MHQRWLAAWRGGADGAAPRLSVALTVQWCHFKNIGLQSWKWIPYCARTRYIYELIDDGFFKTPSF